MTYRFFPLDIQIYMWFHEIAPFSMYTWYSLFLGKNKFVATIRVIDISRFWEALLKPSISLLFLPVWKKGAGTLKYPITLVSGFLIVEALLLFLLFRFFLKSLKKMKVF